ncbi:leucine-rich repeat domain-containing protein [Gemella cuniculi]|uniref:leucine-rich repeat domain-containing protein n=1 Tax=Gemella cuniculi TaxID=150240 RepID=UPI00040C2654|nr:leucine-rich repeat domain-containing protein [Gemella cuniculi]
MKRKKTTLVATSILTFVTSPLIPLANPINVFAKEVSSSASSDVSKDEAIKGLIPESELAQKDDDKEVVNIPDYNLRRGVCELMGYKDIDNAIITKRDMRRIRYLSPEVCQVHNSSEYGVKVKSIEGLQFAENLEKLSMVNQNFNDISPLKNLTKLKYLDLRNVAKDNKSINDVSPLKNLNSLEYLNLFKAEIKNAEELKGLTNLKTLNLGATKIKDIEFLKNMTEITYLNLEHNNISDVSALENLVKVKTLLLDARPKTYFGGDNEERIKDISRLEKLKNLEELGVSNHNIENIDVVKNFKKLVKFHATNNNIENFEVLLSLSALQEVWVQENKNNIIKSNENYALAKEVFRKLNKDILEKQDQNTIENLLNGNDNIAKFFAKETLDTLRGYKEELKNKDKVANNLFKNLRLENLSGTIEKIAKVNDIKLKVGESLEDKLPKTVKVRVKVDKEIKGELIKNPNGDILKIAVVDNSGKLVKDSIELNSSTGKKYVVKDGFVEINAKDAAINYVAYSLNYNNKKVFEFYNTRINRVGNIIGAKGEVEVDKAQNIDNYLVINIDRAVGNKVEDKKDEEKPKPSPKEEPKTEIGNVGIEKDQISYKVVDESGKDVKLDKPLTADAEYDSKVATYENGLYKFKSTGDDWEYNIKLNSEQYQLVGKYSFETCYNPKLASKNSFGKITKNDKRENFKQTGNIKDKDLFVIVVKNLKNNSEEVPSEKEEKPDHKNTVPSKQTDSKTSGLKFLDNKYKIFYRVVDENGQEIRENNFIKVEKLKSSLPPQNLNLNSNNFYEFINTGTEGKYAISLNSNKYRLVGGNGFDIKYDKVRNIGVFSSITKDGVATTDLNNIPNNYFEIRVEKVKDLNFGNDARIGIKKDSKNNVSINYKVVNQNGKEIKDANLLRATSPNNLDIPLKYNDGIYSYTSQGQDDTFTLKLTSSNYTLAHSYKFRDKYNMKTFKGEISSVQIDNEESTNLENTPAKFFTVVVNEKNVVRNRSVNSNYSAFRLAGEKENSDTVDVDLPVEYDLSSVNINKEGEYEVVGKVAHSDKIKNPENLKLKIRVVVEKDNSTGKISPWEEPALPEYKGDLPTVSEKGEENKQKELPKFEGKVPQVEEKTKPWEEPTLPEYKGDLPTVSEKGEENKQKELPKFEGKVPQVEEKTKPWEEPKLPEAPINSLNPVVEPELPEFPLNKVPKEKCPQLSSQSLKSIETKVEKSVKIKNKLPKTGLNTVQTTTLGLGLLVLIRLVMRKNKGR